MPKSKDQVSPNGTPEDSGKRITIQASHVVSFRLSDSKYQQLARMSEICKDGTAAELAREMVCDVLNHGRDEKELALSYVMKRLAIEVTELQARVTRLISLRDN